MQIGLFSYDQRSSSCASGLLVVDAKLIFHFIFISFSMKFSHLEKIKITALSKVAYSTEYIDLCYF